MGADGHNGTAPAEGGAPPIGGTQNMSMIGQLLALLLSERSGINIAENKANLEDLEKFTRQMVEKKDPVPTSTN
jgi:hypothetical protein